MGGCKSDRLAIVFALKLVSLPGFGTTLVGAGLEPKAGRHLEPPVGAIGLAYANWALGRPVESQFARFNSLALVFLVFVGRRKHS